MSTPKGYTTRLAIENYLLITIDPSFYTQVDDWICEMERYIDQQTGRNFVAGSTASERRFDGDGSDELIIDDATEITSLKLTEDGDELTEDDGDFVTYPKNAVAKGIPITKIKLLGSTFPDYPPQGITVEGKWGYSETVPLDIKQAATVLVVGIINYSWDAEGEVQSVSIGRYSVSYKTDPGWKDFERITDILKSYKKFTF